MTRTRINVLLLVSTAVLLVAAVVLYAQGRDDAAGRRAADYAEIVEAAEAQMTAFLTMDHERFDELSERVLAGSAGTFEKEYRASLDTLRKTAQDEKWIADPTIDAVGISDADADSATVFVSAGTTETFTSAGEGEKTRPWRIKLEMVRTDDRWLVTDVGYVG